MDRKSKTPPRGHYIPPHLRNKQTGDDNVEFTPEPTDSSTRFNRVTPVKNEEKTTPIKSNQSVLDSKSPANNPSPNTTPTRVTVALPPVAALTPEKTPTPSPAKASDPTTPKSNTISSLQSTPRTPSKEWGWDESLETSFEKLKIKEETPKRSPTAATPRTPKTPESPYTPIPIDEHIPRDVMHSLSYALEISNIPSDMNTEDIDVWIETAQDPESYELKWVNEQYCLAIFPSISIARHVYKTLSHPDFVLKEFARSSEDSKRFMLKREKLDYLLPSTDKRPARTAVVARRLIAGALQKPEIQKTPEQKADERELRKQREEKRRQQSQERDAE